jgi:hypothetical protein
MSFDCKAASFLNVLSSNGRRYLKIVERIWGKREQGKEERIEGRE